MKNKQFKKIIPMETTPIETMIISVGKFKNNKASKAKQSMKVDSDIVASAAYTVVTIEYAATSESDTASSYVALSAVRRVSKDIGVSMLMANPVKLKLHTRKAFDKLEYWVNEFSKMESEEVQQFVNDKLEDYKRLQSEKINNLTQ